MTTKLIWTVYIILTGLCIGLLCLGGMNLFDGVCHSFSIMGTGGYSTKQDSIAYWDSPFIEYVTSAFMVIASLNFSLLVLCLQGKFGKFFKDGETRWFLGSVCVITLLITVSLFFQRQYPLEEAFRKALFQVSTIHTSCGLVTDDYTLWPQFTWLLLIFAILAGGCTGSTAGGIKNMRIMILFHAIKNQFKRLIHPNAILPVRINKHVVPLPLLNTVTTFTLFYLLCGFAGCFLLTFFGIDFLEALTSSLSAMGNTGLGFGYYGPAYTMSSMPDVCQWIMSFLMLIGRLELFSVLILFSPVFWKEW